MYLPSQQAVIAELHYAKRKEVFFVAGKGCGKSHVGADILISHACVPGTTTFIGAASETIMGISTMPALIRQCRAKGLIPDIHFVIGKMSIWDDVPAFSGNVSTRNIITWRWGSYTVFKTLSDPEAVEGAQFDFSWIDEYGLMDIEEVRRMLRDRMRGEVYIKLGRKHQTLFTGTPPNAPKQLGELRKIRDALIPNDPELSMIFGKTIENPNLPDDFIDYNKDPINFRRDYEGSLEMPPTNMWCYNHSDSKHIGEFELHKGTLYVYHDFNVNPGTALIIQTNEARTFVGIYDEVYLIGGDLPQVCEMVKSRYPDIYKYRIGGDSAGHSGTHLELGKTSFRVMMQKYGVGENQLIIRKKNPLLLDSSLLMNSILNAEKEKLTYLIHPRCKHLIEDRQLCGRDEAGKIAIPSPAHGHLLDCERYFQWDVMRDFVKWK
jgi:hypothetical protein